MAVVLVIIGLLMAAAISFSNSQLALNRLASTKTKQEAIKNALIGFIARNNRLPCPAIPTKLPGEAGYGTEAATGCASVPGSGGVATGVVPWSSIGISDEGAQDGYYNRFTYQVTIAATALTTDTLPGLIGINTVHTSTPIALGSPAAGGNQSNDCGTGAGGNPCAAVAVVISHGDNGLGAYLTTGSRKALPGGTDEAENTDGDPNIVIKDSSNNTANPFDDIVLALSPNELLGPLQVNGNVKYPQAIVANQLQTITGLIVSEALRNRSADPAGSRTYPLTTPGSSPNYLVNLSATALPTNLTIDPWGSSLVYERFLTSISTTTDASSLAYSLRSIGPDRIYNTSDDSITYVYAAELKAKFNTYNW